MSAFSLLYFLFSSSGAQPQHNHWFFGYNAGLDFSGGSPVPDNAGMIQTDEGTASISSADGSLLFYTNGETVFNANHQVMTNGTGLWGSYSSTQSAIIVPVPRQDSVYYVFTTAAQAGGPFDGLAYSTVDMRMQNGLGEVVQKNQPLMNPSTEKLTATRHANGRDVWVLSHQWNSDAFFAFRVTCDGILPPVVSHSGSVHLSDGVSNGTASAIGAMKISPDGRKLALCWSRYASDTSTFSESRLEYFDFDNTNGIVSNPRLIEIPVLRTYGVAFSPSSRFVYLTTYGLVNGMGYADLRQYDLNAADVPASMVMQANGEPPYGSLQLGPDGKLYTARLSFVDYISRIDSPDSLCPSCGFSYVTIDQGMSTWGLPNHWDNYPELNFPEVFSFEDTSACEGFVVTLNAAYPDALAWVWSNGATQSQTQVSDSGEISVMIILPCDTVYDTVRVHFYSCEPPVEYFVCQGDTVRLGLEYPGAISYVWSNGEAGPFSTVVDSGFYWVQVEFADTSFRDSFHVGFWNCECIFFQNVFSPNADTWNDCFCPVADCELESFELFVFDRWGRKVFESDKLVKGWDGTCNGVYCSEGVYYFISNWKQPAGPAENRTGWVTLIR